MNERAEKIRKFLEDAYANGPLSDHGNLSVDNYIATQLREYGEEVRLAIGKEADETAQTLSEKGYPAEALAMTAFAIRLGYTDGISAPHPPHKENKE